MSKIVALQQPAPTRRSTINPHPASASGGSPSEAVESGQPACDLTRSDILDAHDVANLFGLDRKTVYAAIRRREIPHKRLGRKLLFSRQALVEWWAAQGRVVSGRT